MPKIISTTAASEQETGTTMTDNCGFVVTIKYLKIQKN